MQRHVGASQTVPFKVVDKKYREQQLKVPEKQVNLSPEDAARVETEQKHLRALYDALQRHGAGDARAARSR